MSIQDFAQIAANSFQTNQRQSKEAYKGAETEDFVCTVDGAPEWVKEMVYQCHVSTLPDDFIYKTVSSVCDALAEYESNSWDENVCEIADSLVDTYTHDLHKWFNTHSEYVDQARDEFGAAETIDQDLRMGQYTHISEIVTICLSHISDANDEHEDSLDGAA